MEISFTIDAQELNQNFLVAVKSMFKEQKVRIIVTDELDDAHQLLMEKKAVHAVKKVIELDIDDFKELKEGEEIKLGI